METEDKLQERYDKFLRLFCQSFEDSLKKIPGSSNAGFIFLFVRDSQPDCMDIASNLDFNTQIHYLEEALRKLKLEIQ